MIRGEVLDGGRGRGHQGGDGLKIAADYTTFGKNGNPYGLHTATEISVTEPFDASRVVMPEGGVIDETSRTVRASS